MRKRVSFLTLCFFLALAESNVNNGTDFSFWPSITGEQYNEDLVLRPLPDGKVVSSFTFATFLEDAVPRDPRDVATPAQHYTLFPLTLGQILREYSITELHLSLNAGKWNYDSWGYPEDSSVGAGAELWAWMADGGPLTIDERWTGLRNALAGLFCASLGSIDARRTSSPVSAFPLSSQRFYPIPYALRHAILPSEHVCTENLTPFLKLLPCKSRAGLARLLNPQCVFDADWHGLSVHVLSTKNGLEMQLGVQAVLDPVRGSGGKRRDWSFRSLFDRDVDISCLVASSSAVRVVLPSSQAQSLSPDATLLNETVAVYNLISQVPLDVSMSWPNEHTFQYPLPPLPPSTPLSIRRTLYGSSQTHGVLSTALSNNEDEDITVGYLETLPALVTLWMHTMRVEVGSVRRDDLVTHVSYQPPLLQPNGQHTPSMLQATLTVPAKSTLRLSIAVNKAFLKYTEHPPDAMRGWDLPPAILFPVDGSQVSHAFNGSFAGLNSSERNGGKTIRGRMYTPTLLVDLPTPDFSMPYNVIILSCTLMTLIFGSIFNLLTRKWVIVRFGE
ncbi:GPI transamidase component PIG-T [Phlebopus sp. FC_14]|nr:GPI transamidase component PIG-T [Phlebopus sp. FC_14]